MERRDRPALTLFWGAAAGSFVEGGNILLEGDPARHAHVRRVKAGDAIRLLDGAGRIARGLIASMGKDVLTVDVARIDSVPKPIPLHVLVPVADRDRMLLAAEKCAELQVTSLQPVHYARSLSVSPRGEGPKFREKVRARMQSALEQSGGAWLPTIMDDAEAVDVLRDVSETSKRFMLDMHGEPVAGLVASVPITVAVGPEGGLEASELAVATEHGWMVASLGPTTLRFETAVISAAAVIRAIQLTHRST